MDGAAAMVPREALRKGVRTMVRSLMNRTNRNDLAPFAPLSRVFESFFDEPLFALTPMGMGAVGGTQQATGFALDLSEDDQNLIVRATLPGFSKEDINVEVDEGVLTISAEHNEEKTQGGEGERFYRRERRFGSVQRRIALPVPIQDEDASAELVDGVLTLRLPKVQKAPARKINIGEKQGALEHGGGRQGQQDQQPGQKTGGSGGNRR
jgi:HSP20 family protein